ncbi:ubiquitin carboxyl-terminal hydrolase MINDY-1 isoform X2 [Melospiza georgiana]|uniref:ubiquitin carboxyl-terminal hydrolase MINDY-1 isoform X2 n=1 Tax=Melospiza georgiana TaxID=44398 RepID=UPI0025AD35CF|nr:ubiquitin carboxyl-terminal hydrolase MINDY-1 isoform X2 [Melospiza georgiana]
MEQEGTPKPPREAAGGDGIPGAGDRIPNVGDRIPDARGAIPNVGDVIPCVGDTNPSIGDGIPNVGDGIPNVGDTIPDVGGAVPNVGDEIPSVGDGVPSVGGGIPGVGDTFPCAGDGIPSAGDTVPNVRDEIPALGDGIPSVRDTIPGAGHGIPDVGDRIPGAGGTILNVGGTVPNFRGGIPSVGDAVPSVGDTIPGAGNSQEGSGSPSGQQEGVSSPQGPPGGSPKQQQPLHEEGSPKEEGSPEEGGSPKEQPPEDKGSLKEGGSPQDRGSPQHRGSPPAEPPRDFYFVKWILWKGQRTALVTQGENGPCPLLAIINILLLQWKVKLPPQTEVVTAEELMAHLGNCILATQPKDTSEGLQLNFQQNISDTMTVLPKLSTGLDVNVRFTGVSDFEYTPECIVFDLLNIPLYHGWLVDPQSPEQVQAVGKLSYNQLVEKIITCKHASDSRLVSEGLVAEQFLEATASQLTFHGLCELTARAREGELGVFFRNNHFSTMIKHQGHLYLLVTDQGFLQEEGVVWESLHSVDGDSCFCDTEFHLSHPLGKDGASTAPPDPRLQQRQVDQAERRRQRPDLDCTLL